MCGIKTYGGIQPKKQCSKKRPSLHGVLVYAPFHATGTHKLVAILRASETSHLTGYHAVETFSLRQPANSQVSEYESHEKTKSHLPHPALALMRVKVVYATNAFQ